MSQIPSLISDLAVILMSAGLVTLLFKKLKQPVVLGYIVAGILAGPAIKEIPTVTDVESIRIWADIGVVFLLFALGLDFSFKKLMKVGGTAVIGAITVVIGMMTFGYITGLSLGWGHMNSLFLGGMLSMSSTTIIFKAFDDMGLRNQRFAGVVFGILVVEDLFAVLLMVLLSTLAVSKHVEGMELLDSVIKLGVFLLFCFVVGIYLIPSFLKRARTFLNDETLLIVSIGLCLGMVMIATKAGFSSALGAFVMGSILAETIDAEHIEHIVKPVKDLFGAIFFVSVGMLIDPVLLWEYKIPILILTLVVMVGQILFATFGVLLSGQTVKVAIQSGFSLAQIGEFAFIIASLGLTLKVTDNFLYPIVVAVSVITTFFTPYMIRMAEPAYKIAERVIPASWMSFLERYSSGSNTIRQKSAWDKLLKALVRIVGTYTAVTLVLIFIWLQFVAPFIIDQLPGLQGQIISLVLILLLISPMLRAIMMKKNHSEEFQQLWSDSKYNRGRLVSMVLFRVFVATFFVSLVLIRYFHIQYGIVIIIALGILALFLVFRRDLNQYARLEKRFLLNLNQREEAARRRNPLRASFKRKLSDKDIHLTAITVSPNSPYAGLSLGEISFRKTFGVSVVEIIRGDHKINIPDNTERVYPQDRLVVVGSDEQIQRFSAEVERMQEENRDGIHEEEVTLQSFTVEPDFPFLEQTLAESHVGNRYNCVIVGVERDDNAIMNPNGHTIFKEGDLVWVVGERDNIRDMIAGKES